MIGRVIPLKALEEFARFDADALREVLGSVESLPIALCDDLTQSGVYRTATGRVDSQFRHPLSNWVEAQPSPSRMAKTVSRSRSLSRSIFFPLS